MKIIIKINYKLLPVDVLNSNNKEFFSLVVTLTIYSTVKGGGIHLCVLLIIPGCV